MSETLLVSCKKFYQQAKDMLGKKEFVEFLLNLGGAESLSGNEDEMMAEISYLKVQGCFMFNQYKKGVEYVEEALKYNKGQRALRLKSYKGIMLGYLGELSAAKEFFMDFVNEVQEVELLVEVYLNLSWVVGTLYKRENELRYLEELKRYLDLANARFNDVCSIDKGRILDNISFYHYSVGEYEEAIKKAEEAITYSEEKDLPKIYNNLAAIYQKLDSKDGGCSIKGREYMKKAETLAEKYGDNIEIGTAHYNQAMAKLQDSETMSALDLLSSACEYFKKAQAVTLLCDCELKINEILSQYRDEQLRAVKEIVKNDLESSSLFAKI